MRSLRQQLQTVSPLAQLQMLFPRRGRCDVAVLAAEAPPEASAKNAAAGWQQWRGKVGLASIISTPFYYYYYYYTHSTECSSFVQFKKIDETAKEDAMVSDNQPSPPKMVNDDDAAGSGNDTDNTIANDKDDEDEEDIFDKDCPMCEKMLAGPCAAQFRDWYACSKQGEGDEYLELCRPHFDELLKCLEEHESSDSENEDD